MKTSLDTYQPPTSFPLLPTNTKSNLFAHERYRAQTQGVNISLTTQEGDQITISQNTSIEQLKAKYKSDTGLSKIEASLTSANMSFSVKGDLNDQELADLSKLLNNLSGIADDFFKGNLTQAMTDALDIGDMGSINTLDATFTRTSALSTYLEVPHPIPSFAEQQNNPLLQEFHDKPAKSKGPSQLDTMAAQWRQFLDSLTEKDSLPSQQTSALPANSAAPIGKQMLDLARETMSTHPRLTPLIPSVVGMAIDQALQQYSQDLNSSQSAQKISRDFTKELNSWFL